MSDMQPIRILHVIGIMNRGGAETMIMNLYRHIDRSKVQFDFVVHSVEKAVFDDEIYSLGGKIFYCPKFKGKNYFEYKKWWNAFFSKEGKEYKIVHGHIGSTASIYLKIAKEHGKYAIAHSHNTWSNNNPKGIMYKIMSYNTRNVADYFFACSDEAGCDRYGKNVIKENDRYSVLKNAIDTKLYNYNQELRYKIRQELGYKKEEIVIGHVGRFAEQKNHKFLLDVFRDVAAKNNKARLLLIGDGNLRVVIEEKAKSLGIFDKVKFMGVRSDVNEIMQAMDVFVFPSLYEGLGVVLIEAQTAGLPCVISDTIPSEGILINELVKSYSLEKDCNVWSDGILNMVGCVRKGYSQEIAAKGYDINSTAKWLEDFYDRAYREQN